MSGPIVKPLSADRLYKAGRAVNNAKRPRASVSHTTNQPTDGNGERSVVTGRFTCRTVYLRTDSDSRRAFTRYVARHGISHVVVETITDKEYPSAVDVAGIDGKRDDSGQWANGEALDTFLSQSFVIRWEYRSTARVSTVGSGACSADSLSPAKQRELRQPASGLRRYDLQPAHRVHDVDTSAPIAHKTETPIERMFRVLTIAVDSGCLPFDMAGALIDLFKNGAMDANAITDSVVPVIVEMLQAS